MRVRKRGRAIGAAAAALLLASSLVPAQALAGTDRPEPAAVPASAGDVAYVARRWDGSRVVSETRTTRDPWYVRGSEGQFNGPEAGGGGWHYAGTSLRFADRVDVHGTVDLVLGDGVTLTFEDGLHVGPNDTLNVYAQSGGTGTLRALGDTNFVAAIGGNDGEGGGALTVHGGNVVADCYNDNSGEDAAGIGGGNAGSGGAVTIYGGKVEATGANYGAGIGSGDADGGGKSGGTFRMYGGEVVARGGCDGAGIGGGEGGGGADFEMWGGKVTATGGTKDANDSGAGIGSGDRDGRSIGAGAVRIHGGTVVAQGGPDAAGIGGGNEVGGGDVAIDGGAVEATGGELGAGIGGGQRGGCGTVALSGGTVTAKGGEDAPAVGAGSDGSDGGVVRFEGAVADLRPAGGAPAVRGAEVSIKADADTHLRVVRDGKAVPAGERASTLTSGAGQAVKVEPCDHEGAEPRWAWRDEYTAASIGYYCDKCACQPSEAAVASERTDSDHRTRYTARATLDGREFTAEALVWSPANVYDRYDELAAGDSTIRIEGVDYGGSPVDWYVIGYDGGAGTVELLSKQGIGFSTYKTKISFGEIPYRESSIRGYVEGLTADGQPLAPVRDALAFVRLQEPFLWGFSEVNGFIPYIPSKDEAQVLSKEKMRGADGGRWFTRTRAGYGDRWCVDGADGRLVTANLYDVYEVRVAMKLSLDRLAFDSEGRTFSLRTPREVTLSGGANATPAGGETTQSRLFGAMATVTYTANEGCRFEEFEPFTRGGVTVARTADGKVAVSGTPTADVEVVVPDAVPLPRHTVTLSGGANATPDGETTQDGVYAAMATVTYTANAGCRFAEFEPFSKDGVTVARTADDKVTVSGTPTADVELTVPDAAPLQRHSVAISGGANATPDGATTQDGLVGAMRTVTYTANEGHRFEEFGPVTRDGVTVQMVSRRKVAVSGTPTADVEVSVPDAVPVAAEEVVPYRAWDGSRVAEVEGGCRDYLLLEGQTTWEDGAWYVAEGVVSINDAVRVQGTANLILCDGASVTANKGIRIDKGALNVYGQSGGTGRLTSTSGGVNPGIGGNGCAVAIHGGEVIATGSASAGVGGSALSNENGSVTVYGGRVTATGGRASAGIGNSSFNTGNCSVAIHGGEVIAMAGMVTFNTYGAGIGGSAFGQVGSITLSGGVVTAYGSGASAIGAGTNGTGGDVRLDGATVRMYPGADENGKFRPAVTAASVAFGGEAAQDVLFRAKEGDELSTAAETDRVSVLTSSGRQYVEVRPAQAHVHQFSFTADGATITAACTEDCPLPGHAATATISAPELTSFGQEGASAEATVDDPAGILGGAKVEYQTRREAGGTVSYGEPSGQAPTGAGDHRASVTVGGATAYVDYRVAKAAPVAAIPEGVAATYGERLSDVGLANPEGNTDGLWAWDDPAQVAGDAGERSFKATFTPADARNYESAAGIDVPVAVGKAESPAVAGGRVAVGVGQSVDLASCVVRCGARGEASFRIAGDARGCSLEGSTLKAGNQTGRVRVEATVAGDPNFLASSPMDIQVEVTGKALQQLSFASSLVQATYGDASVVNPLSGAQTAVSYSSSDESVAWVSDDGEVTVAGAGRATIVAAAEGTDEVAAAAAFYVLEVAKAPCVVTAPVAAEELVANGEARALVTPGSAEGGRLQYALGTESGPSETYSDGVPAASEMGTYHVWYRAAGDSNHLDSAPACVVSAIHAPTYGPGDGPTPTPVEPTPGPVDPVPGPVPVDPVPGPGPVDPAPVPSATEVPYVARWWDGSQVVSEARSTRDYWYVRGSEEQFNGPEAGGGGWHYAGASVRFVDRVSVNGTVDLVLKDGVTLTFEDGLHVPPGSTLNVYGQGGGSGTLKALGDTNSVAAIGGNDGEAGGTVNVYGGNVVADAYNGNEGEDGAGIGGGNAGSGGSFAIYGGRVEATGANYGAGIGGGDADGEGKSGGTVRVYGGEVVARGGTDSAGIGGGEGCGGADFEMWGGTVNATAGVYGAGIGGGNNGPGGTIRIDGGDVTATGGDGGAGIGGGNNTNTSGDGSGGSISISGGTVVALGGSGSLERGGAGVGGGSGSPGGTITISDGDVTAKGGTYAAGVGGGAKGASGNVTIDGGTVRASCGGLSGAGIGSGAQCDEKDSVNVTINGGLVEATAGKGYEDYDHAAYPGAAIGAGGFDYIFASLVSNDDSLFDGDIRLNGGRITAKAGEAVFARSEGKERDKKRFDEDSNYCNVIGTTDESGLDGAVGTVHFGGAVVHIEPQKDLGGAWSQAVRATSVTFGRKAMDVLFRTEEGGELSLAAEADRVGVLTSAGRQYVQVSPSEEVDAGGGEVLPTPEGPLAVSGLGHVQGVGDVAGAAAADGGVLLGTTGQARRLEAISLNLPAESGCHVEYRSHLQGRGWESDWAADGALSGTVGEARRVEAVQMRLSGDAAGGYSVWYRVHSQTWGWLGWASDGQAAGTAGQAKRVEAVEVCVLPKGQLPEGYVDGQASYVGAARGAAHVQGTGWEALRDSLSFGTTGEARRLEALRLELANQPLSGGIDYAAHVQGAGWLGATDGEVAGTTGESRRVEAVRVTLTGEMATEYTVWYRVHSQSYGWLGWAHDGEDAGTVGLAKRAEAVEVQILPKDQTPAGYDPSVAAYVVGL